MFSFPRSFSAAGDVDRAIRGDTHTYDDVGRKYVFRRFRSCWRRFLWAEEDGLVEEMKSLLVSIYGGR